MIIDNVVVSNLEESIVASGLPMTISTSDLQDKSLAQHLERAKKLGSTNGNSGHGNFLSGINVSFNITYPSYWSNQFQRYHFIQIVSSQSKMHRLSKFDLDKSFNSFVTREIIDIIKKYQVEYNEDPSYENYMKLLSNCPLGIELTMRVSTNYLQLKNIYNQRSTHKLKDDWGYFCNWCLELPLFKELTGV